MQMPLAHRMKRPDQTTLQQCEERFRRINVHVAACILAYGVTHGRMSTFEVATDAAITRQLVRVDARRGPDRFPNHTVKRASRHIRHDTRTHVAVALDQRDHGRLLRATSALT